MECSIGFHVLYYAAQRYRLGSSHLYFDKPLTRPLAGDRNASGARFTTAHFFYLLFTFEQVMSPGTQARQPFWAGDAAQV